MSTANAASLPAERAQDRWQAHWPAILTALVAFRVLLPLAALAASGASLPLLPRYDYVPLNGDANGYYEAITNLFDAFRSVMFGWAGTGVVLAVVAYFATYQHLRFLYAILPCVLVLQAAGARAVVWRLRRGGRGTATH